MVCSHIAILGTESDHHHPSGVVSALRYCTVAASDPQNACERLDPVLDASMALFLRQALFDWARFGWPLSIVYPALHERPDHDAQIDGYGWCACLYDDLVVDLRVHSWRYLLSYRVVWQDLCHDRDQHV